MAQKLLIFTMILKITISLISKSNGLTMKMIPIDSPRLQILPQSFTTHERTEYLINISISRAYNNVHKSTSKLNPNSFDGPLLGLKSSYYVTSLSIGEGPGAILIYLLLDTGAEQTWVQCEGCNPCIELSGKNFAYKKSPSFIRMSVTDRLCVPTDTYQGSCMFQARYTRSRAIGFVGKDNFHFHNPKTGNVEVYKGLAFGCALENNGFTFGGNTGPQNVIAGIHGLAPGTRSFLYQLNDQIKGRFSYCIPSWKEENPRMSTMYFGDDAQISGDDTRQVKVISMHSKFRYHLYLRAISVDGSRLPIDPSVFELDPIRITKGFIIDSGAPYTVLVRRAHDPLRDAIAKYFEDKHDLKPSPPPEIGFQLCYDSYPQDISFPSVILHFLGKGYSGEIDMVLDKDNMFKKDDGDDGFCMMVLPINDPGPSMFGAFQQANFKILYDVSNYALYFVPQRCKGNIG